MSPCSPASSPEAAVIVNRMEGWSAPEASTAVKLPVLLPIVHGLHRAVPCDAPKKTGGAMPSACQNQLPRMSPLNVPDSSVTTFVLIPTGVTDSTWKAWEGPSTPRMTAEPHGAGSRSETC